MAAILSPPQCLNWLSEEQCYHGMATWPGTEVTPCYLTDKTHYIQLHRNLIPTGSLYGTSLAPQTMSGFTMEMITSNLPVLLTE